MGWIDINDKYPPEGLLVLVEMSGRTLDRFGCTVIDDHAFNLASWVVPYGSEGKWVFHGQEYNFPEVYAWMPLPKHFQPQEIFGEPEDDLLEHAMFEDDPEWLYKGDCVYEQISIEDWLRENGGGEQ